LQFTRQLQQALISRHTYGKGVIHAKGKQGGMSGGLAPSKFWPPSPGSPAEMLTTQHVGSSQPIDISNKKWGIPARSA